MQNRNKTIDLTNINYNNILLNLRKSEDVQIFKNQIFPWHFLLHFNLINGFDHTNLHHIDNLKKLSKRYNNINWSQITPQGILYSHYKKFISITNKLPNIVGNKLIEIGVGHGGFSYTAQKVGFNVTCTTLNVPQEIVEKSWELLEINPITFKMGHNSFSELLKDDSKANIVYSNGVPFNRDFSIKNNVDPYDNYWYDDVSYWFPIVADVFENLSDEGFFFSYHNYHLSQSLANDLIFKMKAMYNSKCKLLFHCYAMNLENKQIPVTNMIIIKNS